MDKQTPLYDQHVALGAKMAPFCGWAMPLNYGSQIEEHHYVRKDCGMFDVSHMTIIDILGTGGRDLLRNILANDVDKIKQRNGALYSCMLNHEGGIIDDCIVYFLDSEHYRVIFNAATYDRTIEWLNKQSNGYAVGLHVRHDLAMLAVQGPEAMTKCANALPSELGDMIKALKPFQATQSDYFFVARTGYTGEDGVEVILSAEKITDFWQELLAQGVHPCGLGARDTLRLEAGLFLSGTDMDETVNPLISCLGWTVAWEPQERLFIGRAALEIKRSQGVKRKLVGLVLEDKGIMRGGQKVKIGDDETGIITSGSFSPTLQCSIAFARVPVSDATHCEVNIRNKWLAAKMIKPIFVRKGKQQFE